MTVKCETCRFWERLGTEFGDCHRRAPMAPKFDAYARRGMGDRMEVTVSTSPHAWWPNTAQNDWCGEHQPIRPQSTSDPAPDPDKPFTIETLPHHYD